LRVILKDVGEAMTWLQTQDKEYLWIYFLGLTAHLLDKDSIGSFRIRVPFCALITAGMESLATGFGSQARKKRAAFLARASTLYSFLFEGIARIERELGPTDAEALEKGKQLW